MVRKLRGSAIQAGTITADQISAGAVAANVAVYDEGNLVTTSATSVNFVGNSITATAVSGNVTVTVAGTGGDSTGFSYGNTAPVSPSIGSRWLDSDSGKEFIWVVAGATGVWIQSVGGNGPQGNIGNIGATGATGITGATGAPGSPGSAGAGYDITTTST